MAGGGQTSSSESTQNAIVQYTDPQASYLAGNLGFAASQAAQKALQDATNSALKQINTHYTQARYDVQPYRTEGVQALNQL
ncbi:MAG TPA: hypothetical protein VGK47_14405, partial [Nitrososphaeraceae archaeon]